MNKIQEYLNQFSPERIKFIPSSTGSNKLWVSFASRNTSTFTFYKLLQSTNDNVLFINDNTSQYYNAPITELCSGPDELSNIIKHICSFFRNQKIIFIGGSMGGYAALLFGSMLDIECTVLAFSPQTILNPDFEFTQNPELEVQYQDITPQIKNNKKSKFRIISSFHPEDIYHLIPLINETNVSISITPSTTVTDGHNVLKEWKNNGIEIDTLVPKLLNNSINKKKFKDCNHLLEYEVIQNDFQTNLDHYYKGNYSKCKKYFIQLVYLFPEWPHVTLILSNIYLFEKSYDSAAQILSQAIQLHPKAYFLQEKLHLSLAALNKKEELFLEIKKYCNLTEKNEVTYTRAICHNLQMANLPKQALTLRLSTEGYEDKNTNNTYQLGLIYKKLGEFSKAVAYFSKALYLLQDKQDQWQYKCAIDHLKVMQCQAQWPTKAPETPPPS